MAQDRQGSAAPEAPALAHFGGNQQHAEKAGRDPTRYWTKDTDKARQRLDPTRYGDWEMNGRCIDF